MSQKKLGSGKKGNAMLESLKNGVFPDLKTAKVLPFNLMADYWTPVDKGETKSLIFLRFGARQGKGEGGEIIQLPCAFFIENVNGITKSIANGSKRLVGALESAGAIGGDAFQITFTGKKKNVNGPYYSDNWDILPLEVAGFEKEETDDLEYDDLEHEKKETPAEAEVKERDEKVKAASEDLEALMKKKAGK